MLAFPKEKHSILGCFFIGMLTCALKHNTTGLFLNIEFQDSNNKNLTKTLITKHMQSYLSFQREKTAFFKLVFFDEI